MDTNYDVIIFISKYLYFKRRPRIAIFTEFTVGILIVTIFIKNSKKVKRIRNYVSKCRLYL